jgi:DNA-binding transcriptional MerR regulator
VTSSLAIGDFSRATHLSIKTLRYYHRVGLLEPAEIDRQSRYRRYAIGQIPTAQVIRRFRDLDMPLEEIQAVLSAPDVVRRNELISAHLARMERDLARTQGAVAALRQLLDGPPVASSISHKSVGPEEAVAIVEVVDAGDLLPWFEGALGELYATLRAQNVVPAGPSGGVFSNDLFTEERGQSTIFVPTQVPVRPVGRVRGAVVPGVELATILHSGPHTDIDRAYGSLASYVAEHALAIDGPIREYYLVGPHDTAEEPAWRTEIGWPIFPTAAPKWKPPATNNFDAGA